MTLNINKSQFKSSELFYLGLKLTSNGIEPDEGKISIVGLQAPEDKKGVQRLLSLVNWVSLFQTYQKQLVSKKYVLVLGRSTSGSLQENQGDVGVKKMFGIL